MEPGQDPICQSGPDPTGLHFHDGAISTLAELPCTEVRQCCRRDREERAWSNWCLEDLAKMHSLLGWESGMQGGPIQGRLSHIVNFYIVLRSISIEC
jgi:hypothetical protein